MTKLSIEIQCIIDSHIESITKELLLYEYHKIVEVFGDIVHKLKIKDFPITRGKKELIEEINYIVNIPNQLEYNNLLPENTTKEDAIECLIEHIDNIKSSYIILNNQITTLIGAKTEEEKDRLINQFIDQSTLPKEFLLDKQDYKNALLIYSSPVEAKKIKENILKQHNQNNMELKNKLSEQQYMHRLDKECENTEDHFLVTQDVLTREERQIFYSHILDLFEQFYLQTPEDADVIKKLFTKARLYYTPSRQQPTQEQIIKSLKRMSEIPEAKITSLIRYSDHLHSCKIIYEE
ncbi:hypothetical protein NOVO_00030 [Rickettsiales bacterium Ac37b]|nr:hypothetical protein NOVO_00030 [Rickettsiales bacterium Ac37b]